MITIPDPTLSVGNADLPTCVSRVVIDHLGSRWAALVLRQLSLGERRYSELRAAIGGISEKMLAQTLRELERDGFVTRTSYPVVPPHVVYALTALGIECTAHVAALLGWIEANIHDFICSQRRYDRRKRRGASGQGTG
jgi:DNA-binding HxlR family transcriptional regulator